MGFKFYSSRRNKEGTCPLPGTNEVMLTDLRENSPSSVFSAVKAIQREKGGPTEAQGLWGTYERDEADQMEPIKAGFCGPGK